MSFNRTQNIQNDCRPPASFLTHSAGQQKDKVFEVRRKSIPRRGGGGSSCFTKLPGKTGRFPFLKSPDFRYEIEKDESEESRNSSVDGCTYSSIGSPRLPSRPHFLFPLFAQLMTRLLLIEFFPSIFIGFPRRFRGVRDRETGACRAPDVSAIYQY